MFSKGFVWCDGDTRVVTNVNHYSEDNNAIKFNLDNKGSMSWSYASYFDKIDFTFPDDLAKIEEALAPKIQVGSYVKIVKDGEKNLSYNKVGHIYPVARIVDGYMREDARRATGVHKDLLELVTKADYDAYIESKKPKLTFGGKKVTVVGNGVTCEGIIGSITQLKDIVSNPLNTMNHFGGKSVEAVEFSGDVIEQGTYTLNYLIKHVSKIKIGCTTGTLEELQAIIEAGNKLK